MNRISSLQTVYRIAALQSKLYVVKSVTSWKCFRTKDCSSSGVPVNGRTFLINIVWPICKVSVNGTLRRTVRICSLTGSHNFCWFRLGDFAKAQLFLHCRCTYTVPGGVWSWTGLLSAPTRHQRLRLVSDHNARGNLHNGS